MPVTHPIPQLTLDRQLNHIRHEVDAAISDALDHTAFIGGERLSTFEKEFAQYCDTTHCIGVGNGTDALHAIFWALDLQAGDEVIVPAMSFIATLEPLTQLGLKPVLVDIEPTTYNLDATAAQKAITPRTKALLPVHLYGQPADMDALNRIAREHDLVVVEDSAQAHGARFGEKRAGSHGIAAGFSFYPGKNLGAMGDGGAITTSDETLAERIRRYSDHGRLTKYEHAFPGVNSRLDAIQAVVLGIKLRHLDRWNEARARWASIYRDTLSGIGELTLPALGDNRTHVYHQFVVQAPDRDDLMAYLKDRHIYTGLHYPIPLHLQPAYTDLNYQQGDFPHAEALGSHCLSLPMFAELTEEEVRTVADAIQGYFEGT